MLMEIQSVIVFARARWKIDEFIDFVGFEAGNGSQEMLFLSSKAGFKSAFDNHVGHFLDFDISDIQNFKA